MKLYDKTICKLLKQFMTYLEKKTLLSNWKKVNALPICKTESRGLIWKYSPVLLFRIFAKIFELYIYDFFIFLYSYIFFYKEKMHLVMYGNII